MAVVFLRALIFPRRKDDRANYSILRTSSPCSSIRSDKSHDHFLEMGHDFEMNEKQFCTNDISTQQPRIHPRLISDMTIGLSDGLTVPFALTAGLSALGETNVVIYGGLAELIAGGISMGLGGYLGAKSEAEAYNASLNETRALVATGDQERVGELVRSTFKGYDFAEDALRSMVATLSARPEQMVDFIMRFHHQLAEDDYAPSRAYVSGMTISLGYICGGLVALLPYLFASSVKNAFHASVIVMAIALFTFGWLKTALVGETHRWTCFNNGVQMMILGGVAAAAAMGCVKAVGD